LGKLHVEGKKVSEVKEMIQDKIKAGNYIKDPLVSIEFLNFKYTVLGAAGAGTYNVEGDRITLLEAIAKAGDLGANARINRVQVIREEDGVRKVYEHDLRSKDVFESPAYYLQQNDIVYVVPKYKKKDTEDRAIQYGTLVLSVFASICSLLWVLK
jgi:polysaccharide export outer membrane protein